MCKSTAGRAGFRRLKMSDRNAIDDQIERMRQALAGQPASGKGEPKTSTAAVLVPLFERAGELHAIFIRRSDAVASHRGQVAFPGGRIDPGDASPLAAALREAHEEVGIHPHGVDVLGGLPTMNTLSSEMVVAPFVGVISASSPLIAAPDEVADIFDVPFSALHDPRYRGEHEWGRGRAGRFPAILYGGQIIWGLTLRITEMLLEIVDGRSI
jgi:8-oxo-dGTP pyrophosphatase MutT (NUDIX family)